MKELPKSTTYCRILTRDDSDGVKPRRCWREEEEEDGGGVLVEEDDV